MSSFSVMESSDRIAGDPVSNTGSTHNLLRTGCPAQSNPVVDKPFRGAVWLGTAGGLPPPAQPGDHRFKVPGEVESAGKPAVRIELEHEVSVMMKPRVLLGLSALLALSLAGDGRGFG